MWMKEKQQIRSAVSPGGCHDDVYVIQEDRAAELKLQMERYLEGREQWSFKIKSGFSCEAASLH